MQNRRKATARALLAPPCRLLRFLTSLTRGPAQSRSLGAGRDSMYKFPTSTPSSSCESSPALRLDCEKNCMGRRQSRVAPRMLRETLLLPK